MLYDINLKRQNTVFTTNDLQHVVRFKISIPQVIFTL